MIGLVPVFHGFDGLLNRVLELFIILRAANLNLIGILVHRNIPALERPSRTRSTIRVVPNCSMGSTVRILRFGKC